MRRLAALVVCLSIWISVDSRQPAHGQQPGASDSRYVAAGLMERALRDQSVRVIVGVRAPFVPEGGLEADAAFAQRESFQVVRRRVLDAVAGLPITHVREFQTIPFFAAKVGAAALAQLMRLPDVTSIEEDSFDSPTLAESTAMIGTPGAWSSGYTGAGWAVAVLDTGVETSHPFLAGATVSEACFSNGGGTAGGTSLCPGGAPVSIAPGSGVNCDPALYDGCYHGTHVAGIAAGQNYAGGPGFNGVAHASGIIPMQVFTGFSATGRLSAFRSDQISALERVFALRNSVRIAAVNMSLGGGAFTSNCDATEPARKGVIDNLRSAGIATVIASGNDGFADALSAPACISSAISVGSVGDGSFADPNAATDEVSYFSNSASFLNLLAPGMWIASSVTGGSFAHFAGTSMATPHVAGAWALMKQRKPLASVTEILNAFIATGTPVFEPFGGVTTPRINVHAAINALRVDYMAFDTPSAGTAQRQPFVMSGWALNMSAPLGRGPGVDAVHVWAFPAGGGPGIPIGVATFGTSRPDVGAAFHPQFTNSGWHIVVRGLRPGTYTLNAYARNTFNGTFSHVESVPNVTVQADPEVWIDTPVTNTVVAKPFVMSGWAMDRAAAGGTGIDTIHVWAYPRPGSGTPPIFLGAATYGLARPDVGAAFGAQFTSSGWSIAIGALPLGPHQLVAFGRSTVTNSFSVLKSTTVTVSEPVTTIDTPGAGTTVSQPFTLSGWAIDLAASAGSGVEAIHVYAYRNPGSGTPPVFVGAATYGATRADVGSIFGARFTNSGYSISVNGLAPGPYRLAVFARSSVSRRYHLQTVDVVIP